MTDTAGNPVSRKYVVTKARKTFIALSDSRLSRAAKTEEVYLHQTCLKEPSQDMPRTTLFRGH